MGRSRADFLLSRQLMYGSKIRTGELLIDPVPFSISVLLVLYTATIIGITVEILFFRSRGEEVRMTFQKQMVDIFQPDVYLFNRNLGTLRLVPLMPLSLGWKQMRTTMTYSKIRESLDFPVGPIQIYRSRINIINT